MGLSAGRAGRRLGAWFSAPCSRALSRLWFGCCGRRVEKAACWCGDAGDYSTLTVPAAATCASGPGKTNVS